MKQLANRRYGTATNRLFNITKYLEYKRIEYTHFYSDMNIKPNWVAIDCIFCHGREKSLHIHCINPLRFICWNCRHSGKVLEIVKALEKEPKKIRNKFTETVYYELNPVLRSTTISKGVLVEVSYGKEKKTIQKDKEK